MNSVTRLTSCHPNLKRVAGFIMLFALIWVPAEASAQWLKKGLDEVPRPLADSDPFDLLILNDRAEDAVLKIKPLGTKMPSLPLSDDGLLIFELFADFDERLEVPHSSIAEIKTFNDLLLEEAAQFKRNNENAKAFRNLLIVYDNGGKNDPQMVALLRDAMFLDATDNFKSGDFELALTIYEDIYQDRPDFDVPGSDKELIDLIMICYDGIIQEKFDKQRYTDVRENVASVAEQYPEAAKQLTDRWNQKFLERSDQLLATAREHAAAGNSRLAHQSVRQADQMVPDREVVLNYQQELMDKFPLIIVGVGQSMAGMDPNRLEHWGSRRVGRLTQRRIMELTGMSDEGGEYTFWNGIFYRADDAGLRYTFELRDNLTDFAVPSLTAFELSSRLLDRAKPESPNYLAAWGKILDRVTIDDDSHVSFTLRTPFVRPEALLTMRYQDSDPPVQNGPFQLANEDGDITTFELNPAYPPVEGRQYPLLIEQNVGSASNAVDELLNGNVDVVDRISPADLDRLKADPTITVRPYVLPTVHFLVPKIRNEELANDANFRNGLSTIINRDYIVENVICENKAVDGCMPISGPFPLGTENYDQIAYGYDLRVRPLPYNESLGMAFKQLALRAQPPDRPEPLDPPKLIIAHSSSSTAANAAQAIARMWTQAEVPTVTFELPPGVTVPENNEWDFLYLEVTVEEPLADAIRLIGSRGFAKDVSAPVRQTLRILNYSRSWQSACSALRRLHRQIRVDLSVIPLWQVGEYYAHKNTIRNVGRDLVHLYQHAERWKTDLKAEGEQEQWP